MTRWNSDASWVISLWVDAAGPLSVPESNPQQLEEGVDEPEDRIPGSSVQTRHVAVDVVMDAIVVDLDGENALSWLGFSDLKSSSSRQQGANSGFSGQGSTA